MLHPQAQAFLDQLAAANPPGWEELSPPEGRAAFASLTDLFGQGPNVARVEDALVDNRVRVRTYLPRDADALPTIVYFHGGGWVLGDLDTHDALCRRLASGSQCAVVSVDFRRSPENVFPAALEDCYAVVCAVANEPQRFSAAAGPLAVAGDSAGGNLAAAVALLARDRGGPTINHQCLIYPVLARDFESPSYRQFAEGFGLTRRSMQWFWEQYVGPSELQDVSYLEPLQAPDLAGLPSAQVITAGYDVLRDEGKTYATRLAEAGVQVERRHYDDMLHGFVHFAGAFARGLEATGQIAAGLREGLRHSSSP